MPASHRTYHDASDLAHMMDVLFEGSAVSPHSCYMHVGDLQWRAFGPHGYPLNDIIEIWEDDGHVAGWVLVASSGGFDYQVRPELRGDALEREFVEWGQAAVLTWRERNGLQPLCAVESFVDDADRIRLLESLGYRPSGVGAVYFSRPLNSIPEFVVPDGWEVRGLRDSDIDSRATCQYEAFAPGSKTTPATWRHLMEHAPAYDAELDTVVVTPDGTVASAALAWLDEHNKIGEFEPVGTRPAYQRQGCGRAALLRGLHAMRDRGMTTAIVQTNATNPAAIALYQSVGFIETNRLADYELHPASQSK